MSIPHKDYYRILQVHPEAEPVVIQAAFRRLAKKYHPDANGTEGRHMVELNEAYAVLSDRRRRAEYDRWYRSAGRRRDAFVPHGRRGTTPDPVLRPSMFKLMLPVIFSLVILVVLILDVFRLGIRGFPEVTLILVGVGWVLYHFGNLGDRLK